MPQPTCHTLSFHGSGGEYFRIWIVNIALTLVTLGIYSAWAKVRTKRYFYENTRLRGVSFTYLAKPKQILKGRMLALLILLPIFSIPALMPGPKGEYLSQALLLLLIPLLMVLGRRFNLRNSAFRNIRFGFTGGYFPLLGRFLLLLVITILSAGLALPYAHHKVQKYLIDKSRYGQGPFHARFTAGEFYMAFFKAFAFTALAGIAITMLGIFLVDLASPALVVLQEGDYRQLYFVGGFLIAFTFMLIYQFILRSFMLCVIWDGTRLGSEHRFMTRINALKLSWIHLSNLFLMLVTLGLFYPWAKVRATRYAVDHIQLHSLQPLDDFLADLDEQGSVVGEEMGDLLDVDFGL